FPGSFVFSMTYSVPLMLAFPIGCLICLLQRRFVLAGLCGALATVTRPNAIVLVACCAWVAFREIRRSSHWKALAAPLLSLTGVVSYYLFLWQRTGHPLAWMTVQHDLWNERFDLQRTVGRAGNTFGHFFDGRPQDLNSFLPTLGIVFALV